MGREGRRYLRKRKREERCRNMRIKSKKSRRKMLRQTKICNKIKYRKRKTKVYSLTAKTHNPNSTTLKIHPNNKSSTKYSKCLMISKNKTINNKKSKPYQLT
jgi:hypothetical protein